jgi:hypothetical protein
MEAGVTEGNVMEISVTTGQGIMNAGGNTGNITVERGPDWLFVRIDGDKRHGRPLSETVWSMLRENLTNRIVLEMESVASVDDQLFSEISNLGRRIQADGGLIRICGLSDENLSRLQSAAAHVPHFKCRTDAVRG